MSRPAHLWFPALIGVGFLVLILDIVRDRDERAALEREVVSLNTCPKPAEGLSDTVAVIVHAPADELPSVKDCIRVQERPYAVKPRPTVANIEVR